MTPDAYDVLAAVYDRLQDGPSAEARADYVERMQKRFSRIAPGQGDGKDGRILALDLGCGTGTVSVALLRRGYDVIGVDRSHGMLAQARAAAEAAGFGHGAGGLTLIAQDLEELELFGTVDLMVCLTDTVNHLVEPGQVSGVLARCAHYLNPGGLLLLDFCTPAYFRDRLGDQVFYDLGEDLVLIWDNTYHEEDALNEADLLLFTREEDGRYVRSDARVTERAYTPDQMRAWTAEAGLEIVAEDRDHEGTKADAATERVILALRKTGSRSERT